MLRKALVGGAALLLMGGLMIGTGLASYLKTGAGWVHDTVKDSVPVEVEIRRARGMIADLQPEIADNMQLIAREKIEVAKLDKQVSELDEKLANAKQDILRLSTDLEDENVRFVYAGRTYSEEQVREDLAARFKRYQTQKATADKLAQMLEARRRSLDAARERMDAMLAAKRQLEVEVENLQARLAAVEVAHASSHLALDDSHLSRTRNLLDEIRTRIDVEEEMLAVDTEYVGAIQLDEPSDEDILQQVTQYFGAEAGAEADADADEVLVRSERP